MCLGIPGQIVAIQDEKHCIASVDVAGVKRDVNIACVVSARRPPASCIGDWVLVHVGFALSRIDQQEAQRSLALLAQLGDIQDELNSTGSTGS